MGAMILTQGGAAVLGDTLYPEPVDFTEGEILSIETSSEILKQLKIMNIHLSLMTDASISKQEID